MPEMNETQIQSLLSAERERCAKLCDQSAHRASNRMYNMLEWEAVRVECEKNAAAIRALPPLSVTPELCPNCNKPHQCSPAEPCPQCIHCGKNPFTDTAKVEKPRRMVNRSGGGDHPEDEGCRVYGCKPVTAQEEGA